MADWDDVRRIALALPEVAERVGGHDGTPQWRVRGRLFAWERPLRRADLAALGPDAPDGPILGARVPHEGAKLALIADAPDVYFTTPHFDGYASILVRLGAIPLDELSELIAEAWLVQAPKRLAKTYLDGLDD